MTKQILKVLITISMIVLSANANDKEFAYSIINSCKNVINENEGEFYGISNGFIIGLARGYREVLRRSQIDNDYASLSGSDFASKMCQIALTIRKEENKKTGGKYNVLNFQTDLESVGYWMINYIEKEDTSTKK